MSGGFFALDNGQVCDGQPVEYQSEREQPDGAGPLKEVRGVRSTGQAEVAHVGAMKQQPRDGK